MKLALILSALLMSSASYATSIAELPLAVKSTGHGFTPPEYQHSKKCEVYQHTVRHTVWVNGVEVVKNEDIRMNQESVKRMQELRKAVFQGEVEHVDILPSDIPTTAYYMSYYSWEDPMLPTRTDKILKVTAGSLVDRRNTAREARSVELLLDNLCDF